jgi:hypothetical protein
LAEVAMTGCQNRLQVSSKTAYLKVSKNSKFGSYSASIRKRKARLNQGTVEHVHRREGCAVEGSSW